MQEKKPLSEYYPSPKIVVVSLGKHNGIVSYTNFAIGGMLAVLLKEVIEWKTMIRYWTWSRWVNPFYKYAEKKKVEKVTSKSINDDGMILRFEE